jgi:hypothetical protein
MSTHAKTLIIIAVLCAITGSLILLLGSSLPLQPQISLLLGGVCFLIVIITTILALYSHQGES